MNRHHIQYFRCEKCGFVQTEEPYWLDDAYLQPIAISDVGLVSRNLNLVSRTKPVINLYFNPNGRFLDYAGGYGLLVRLMRDEGFDFFWHDRYCKNLFSHGFSVQHDNRTFELVTAFEVIEHMCDPLQEMADVLSYSRNILFSTEIIPNALPKPEYWWYYGLEHGQHVSLFTLKALSIMAQKFSLNFYTDGRSIHLFTEKKLSPFLFRLATQNQCARVFNLLLRRKSLLTVDSEAFCTFPESRNDA